MGVIGNYEYFKPLKYNYDEITIFQLTDFKMFLDLCSRNKHDEKL